MMPIQFDGFDLFLCVSRYIENDNLCLQLMIDVDYGWDIYADLTCNFVELEDNQACVDAHNCPWIIDLIEKYKLGEPAGQLLRNRQGEYPIYNFDMKELKKYEIIT